MKKVLSGIVLLVGLLSGCNSETQQPQNSTTQTEKRVWVFAQFNVPQEGDVLDSYWYYGRMSASLYEDIHSNRVQQGFLRLIDVHYWGDDDFVHPYEDDDYAGEMLFKIEDLRKANSIKRPPRLKEQHESIMEQMDVEEASDLAEEDASELE